MRFWGAAAKKCFQDSVHGRNVATPNDPKLSDRGARRGGCTVGGKAVAEAAAVTCGAVRCSAWLAVAVVGMKSLI
jgi:hypothetical protein